MSDRLEFAKEIAKIAGAHIKKLRQGDVGITSKGNNDLLTIADGQSEEIIINAILQNFPDDSILAEENGEVKLGTTRYQWVIDPLDGTVNYAHNIPIYGVSIGYTFDDKPNGGAIYFPEIDEIYYAEKGLGAYCNGELIKVSKVDTLKQAYCNVGTNNRSIEKSPDFNRIYAKLLDKTMNVLSFHCATHGLALIASGKIDVYYPATLFPWDYCTGSVLVEEADGKREVLSCNETGECSALATNGLLHEQALEIIKG